MFHQLPNEILLTILDHCDMNPIELYKLRMINQNFYSIITSFKDYPFPETYLKGKIFHNLSKQKISVKSFDWFLKNNVQFTIPQINHFVKHNRIDLIKRGFHYKQFLDTLFNRFYINYEDENLFTVTTSQNPIIIAAIHNRIDMIDLLLESSIHGNLFRTNITSLLDIGIKYNHKNVIKYLVVNQFQYINKHNDFQTKANKLIHRVTDCEDLIFYCIETKKLILTDNIIMGIISMKYVDLFKYACDKVGTIMWAANRIEKYVKQAVQEESLDILDFLLIDRNYGNIRENVFKEYWREKTFYRNKECSVLSSYSNLISSYKGEILSVGRKSIKKKEVFTNMFTDFIQSKKTYSNKFISHLVQNYLPKISKSFHIIHLCIQMEFDNETILQLIDSEFTFGLMEMRAALDKENIELLKYLTIHYQKD